MNIQEYLNPSCLVLVPVLYVLGMLLKKAKAISDRWIPLLLGGSGILLAISTILTTQPFPVDGQGWISAMLAGVVQGILVAGAAVYTNQIYKQATGTAKNSPEKYMTQGSEELS